MQECVCVLYTVIYCAAAAGNTERIQSVLQSLMSFYCRVLVTHALNMIVGAFPPCQYNSGEQFSWH